MVDYIDAATVYLKLTPSGADVGPYTDSGTVYLDLTVSALEERQRYDAATVYLDLTATGTEVRTVLAPSFTTQALQKWQVPVPPTNRYVVTNEESAKRWLISFSGKAPNVPSS